MTAPVRVSASGRYRRRSVVELLGTAVARLVPAGAVRDRLRRLYRRLLGRGPLECRLPGGEVVRIAPDHRFVTWNPAEYDAFRAATRPGAVVLDVGANVGAYTLLFAGWCAPAGRVFAFEPSGEARAALRQHLALNRAEATVEVVADAVSAATGRASFAEEGIHGTSRLADGASANEVGTVSIDDFCEARGIAPSVIKIDVEGAELAVLRGARRTLARGGVELFVELHPTLWATSGIAPSELRDELRRQGLRAEPLHPGMDPWALEGECVRLVRG